MRLSLLLAALVLAGCASAPHHETAKTVPGDPLAGHWEGTWQSAHGHHGRVLCDVTRLDAHHYQAKYTAYWAALHGSYTVVLEARRAGHGVRFEGSKDLGALYGGMYRYDGSAARGKFHSAYTAKKDNGTFEMTRQGG